MKLDDYAKKKLAETGASELTQRALINYFDHGLRAGQWTRALLANDMTTAVLDRPDEISWETFKNLVHWLYWEAPGGPAWGSYEVVEANEKAARKIRMEADACH